MCPCIFRLWCLSPIDLWKHATCLQLRKSQVGIVVEQSRDACSYAWRRPNQPSTAFMQKPRLAVGSSPSPGGGGAKAERRDHGREVALNWTLVWVAVISLVSEIAANWVASDKHSNWTILEKCLLSARDSDNDNCRFYSEAKKKKRCLQDSKSFSFVTGICNSLRVTANQKHGNWLSVVFK